MESITEAIKVYIDKRVSDDFHRYKSWDHCFDVFGKNGGAESLSLELAFYLASWGMYRGSSGLLQKNHLIHKGAVEIVLSKKNEVVKCNPNNEIDKDDIQAILSVKNQLALHYRSILYTRGAEGPKPISPTDTLLSKIMLGTLGCVPAYDRYFIEGLKQMKLNHYKFNEASLHELFDFIEENKTELETAQKHINSKLGSHYPIMKIVDMYFWQIGYDYEVKEKKKKMNNPRR